MNHPQREIRLNAGNAITAGVCAVLLGVFAILSYSAMLTKSATYDEPLHVLGGFMKRHYADFRINPEDPALFGWIVSLPNPRSALTVDTDSGSYQIIVDEVGMQWPFLWRTLYRTPRNDEQTVLNRSRAMCTLMGVMLGAVIAWWSFKLAGAVAAIGATLFYALCPNFLAHASIVKNDVPLSLVLLSLTCTVWMIGKRGTWLRLASLALLCGAAVSMKYSGVLGGPLVALALTIRALMPSSWRFIGFDLNARWQRLVAAASTCLACAIVAYVFVWAVYGFRYAPTPNPQVRFNMNNLVRLAKIKELSVPLIRAQLEAEKRGESLDPHLANITEEDVRSHQPATIVRFVSWADERGLLPQGWLAGFLYTYATTLVRSTYLNGQIQAVGWWYFFPLAMLYKTPLATLFAMGASLLVVPVGKLVVGRTRFRMIDGWALACLLIAPLLYGLSAINANLNLGLRHILPVYPFIFIGVGIAAAIVMKHWRAAGMVASVLVAIGLAAETLPAYPNYIPFFNTAVGGWRGGLNRLGDSNLDWGQDLKLLARWQKRNPDRKLYLSYFGIADPEYYGVKATHLPGGWHLADFAGTPQQMPHPSQPGVFAVSATNLQGIYFDPQLRQAYREMLQYEPMGVLGGSIYLYEYPFRNSETAIPQN